MINFLESFDILDLMPKDAFAVLNVEDCRLIRANTCFRDWSQAEPGESIFDLYPGLPSERVLRGLRKRGRCRYQTKIPSSRGPRDIHLSFRRIEWGDKNYIFVHGSDRTREREKEILFGQATQALEKQGKERLIQAQNYFERMQRIASLSSGLERDAIMAQAEQLFLDGKREGQIWAKVYQERMESVATLVAGIAHELNTPLSIAQSASAVITELTTELLESPEPIDSEEKEELQMDLQDACHLLLRNLGRVHRLIKSFKQLSAGQLSDEKRDTDIAEIVQDCVKGMQSELDRRQIAVDLKVDPAQSTAWEGYPNHLTQVLVNLLENSLAHGFPNDSGGKITIELSVLRPGGVIRIHYSDDGRGIIAPLRSKIFDAFVTNARDRGHPGLGLAVSHNIVVNLLGGTIACDSQGGCGARFIIDLPSVVDSDKAV